MPKTFTCRDVGVPCDWTAKGETEGEVLQQIGEHASTVHGFADIPPEMMDKVKASIKDE